MSARGARTPTTSLTALPALGDDAGADELFRSLVACADDTIVITDLEGRILFVNDAGTRLYGAADITELIGQSSFDLLSGDSQATAAEGMRLVLTHGVARHREYLLVRRDGSQVPVEMTVSIMRDAHGAPCGFMSITRDISERRRAEARTAALLDVAKAVSGRLEVWEILDRVQQRTAEVLGCDAVATFSWDRARSAFRLIGQHQRRAGVPLDPHLLEFRHGVPFVDRLIPVRTVVINDVDDQPWVPTDLLTAHAIRALVWTQLVVRDRPVGALVALSAADGFHFDPSQVALLEGIAQQLAVAMDTAELYQAQRREAEVSAALARVGRELIASLDQPDLLERLCRLTSEVLGCTFSHTLLLSPVDDAYAVVATHGYAEEQREWMRVVSIPRALLRQTLAALVQADALNLTVPDITTNPLATLARNLGVSAVICMALRQGTEVVGLHVAAACAPHAAFAGQETRIAHGIAQIASLTLQYRRLLEELQGANRLKSDFVATLSHELRSPFNVIIGYGALLLDRVFGDLTPEQAEVIQRIDRSATALLELIDTTLDLSRLENGRLHLDVDEVNLAEILATVDVETREQRAARPRVQFMWHVAAEVPLLRTNGIKLRVILKNLIANAFKFTTAGAVSVDARLEGDGVTVRVRDTGPGIPAEVLPVIFDAFRQAPGTASHLGGVGLGLYIVRQLLTMLGGTVSVESTLGQGTTFSIRLPLEFGARPSSPAA